MSFYGGEWATTHRAPSSNQTNPDNDPEIAASQERLRQYGQLKASDFSNPRALGGPRSMGINSGDDQPEMSREVAWDTPYGTVYAILPAGSDVPAVPPPGVGLRTAEKFWWQPGLAEPMEFTIGQNGTVDKAGPKDSRKSLGESLAQFAGTVVALGATGLAAYGAAVAGNAALGYAAEGTAAGGTAGTAAGGTAAEAATANSIYGLEAAEGWALQGGGAGYNQAAAAAAAGGGGGGTAAMSAGELAAMDAAGGAMAGTGEIGVTGGSSWWSTFLESDLGKAASSELGQQLIGSAVSGVGQAILDDKKRDDAIEDRDNERAYRARNMNAAAMPSIDWKVVQVPRRDMFQVQNPYAAGAPPSALNTPRLPPGPIQTPVIDSAREIYDRNGPL